MRVLIVEDDPVTANSIRVMLNNAGFKTHETDLGEEAVGLAMMNDYDLITLDINLPDISGHEVLRMLRARGCNMPVMVVSGSHDKDNKLKVFEFGADDYLAKPFHREELVARARAIIRRSKGHSHSIITVGALTIDLNERVVGVNGSLVPATRKEYEILELLALRKGTTITKEMLLDHLYAGMDEPEIKIIDVFVCKMRRKLEAMGVEGYIKTVWGRGYKLVDPNMGT